MPPKPSHSTPLLLQVVSDSRSDPDQSDLHNSDQTNNDLLDDESSNRTTLEKLEIQLRKQELLNSQFTSQFSIMQSMIQDYQQSLHLIFEELKVLKQARQSKDARNIPAPQNHQNLHTSSGILGSPNVSGTGSMPPNVSGTISVPQSEIELKKVNIDIESIQVAKCDVVDKGVSRNLVSTDLLMNKLFDADDAYYDAKSKMLDDHIGKKLEMKKLVYAHYLLEEMFKRRFTLYKLPWPPPILEYINTLLCNNTVYGCSRCYRYLRCLIDLAPKASGKLVNPKIVVDGDNGVGGEKLDKLINDMKGLEIEVRNKGENGALNEKVGADYVQKDKVAPSGFGSTDVGIRCASFDGDADRLVYFRVMSPDDNSIDLVDGDKILSLFAMFIKDQIDGLNLENNSEISNSSLPKLGIVQTAYANGASTAYLKRLGLEVVFTPTGVKYLHKKALGYDIGLYFEANGHGTILFSEGFISTLKGVEKNLSASCSGSEKHKAALRLLAVSQLINQAVGDAISGLLLVEAVLQFFGWSVEKWSLLYNDLPSRQLKVEVADRTVEDPSNNGSSPKEEGDKEDNTIKDKEVIQWKLTLHQIGLDVVRTDRTLVYHEDEKNQAKLWDILAIYSWIDRDIGYCQGMSDLCSPISMLIENEADAFWCFERLMRRTRANFKCTTGSLGVRSQLTVLSSIIQSVDPKLHEHIENLDGGEYLFAFRMLIVLFRREFSFVDTLYPWEVMWAMEYNPKLFSMYESEAKSSTASSLTSNASSLKQYGKFERMNLNTQQSSKDDQHIPLSIFLVASVLEGQNKKLLLEARGLNDVVKILNDLTGNLYHI